jgi:hypothetical protein
VCIDSVSTLETDPTKGPDFYAVSLSKLGHEWRRYAIPFELEHIFVVPVFISRPIANMPRLGFPIIAAVST